MDPGFRDGLAATTRSHHEILDAIAHDFPWLADQCAIDKAKHFDSLNPFVQRRRWRHIDAVERQRAARAAIKTLSVGDKVTVNWHGSREAEIIEVRRTRIKAVFPLHGKPYVVDRRADEVQPVRRDVP